MQQLYYSVSYPLSENDNFKITFFPIFSFQGSFEEALFIKKNSILGENNLNAQAGVIQNYTASKGLFYSEFTGLGAELSWDTFFGSMDLAFMGYGYQGSDDVTSFYLYAPKRFIGIGLLYETLSFYEDRLIPEINFEFQIKKENFDIRFFGEFGSSIYLGQIDTKSFGVATNHGIVYPDADLSPGFDVNHKTIAGLGGIEGSLNHTEGFAFYLKLRIEYRYYGRSHGDFYFQQRLSEYYFYTDIRTDDKHNNQPFNFYLYSGDTHGFYLRTEINIPFKIKHSSLIENWGKIFFQLC